MPKKNISSNEAKKFTFGGVSGWYIGGATGAANINARAAIWNSWVSINTDAQFVAFWIGNERPAHGSPPHGVMLYPEFMRNFFPTDSLEHKEIPVGTMVVWSTNAGKAIYGTVLAVVPPGAPPSTRMNAEYVQAYRQQTTNRVRFNPDFVDEAYLRYVVKLSRNPRGGIPVLHIRRFDTLRVVDADANTMLELNPGRAFSPGVIREASIRAAWRK